MFSSASSTAFWMTSHFSLSHSLSQHHAGGGSMVTVVHSDESSYLREFVRERAGTQAMSVDSTKLFIKFGFKITD